MDVSDIYYDRFLVNGKNQDEHPQYKAGDEVRLRIANGGASTYFWLSWSGGKMTVIATDGNDVEPVQVDRLLLTIAETVDVVVTIPDNMSYELLATPEDRTKSASLWLGKGMKMPAIKLAKLKYFAGMKMMNDMMDMQGNMKPMGMKMSAQSMDMNTVMYEETTSNGKEDHVMKMPMEMNGNDANMQKDHNIKAMSENQNGANKIVTLKYTMLRATKKTTLPVAPTREMKFELTGNMNRYVWSMDNKTLSETDKIFVKHGENLRIILYNNSMMRHPMHLHGHDFRLLNGQGAYAPLKNTFDIMPMEKDTIEFAATESGDWFFHCHILYHMMAGMGRVISYENSPVNPELADTMAAYRKLKNEDRMFHPMARIGIESNGSDGEAMLSNTRWKISTMWHLGYHDEHGYESETTVGRYFGKMQWLYAYAGFDYHFKMEGGPKNIFGDETKNMFGQTSKKTNCHTVTAGIQYLLPMLLTADARVDGDGRFRFQLGRQDVMVTKRLRLSLMANTDKEYMAGFRYVLTRHLSLSTHYDSDMGLGAGITLLNF